MRKSFCLESVSSFKDINRSPVNRSTSKHLWSFSKESRFPHQKVYCDNIYDIGGMHPHRYGVSIGKGTKSDFTKDRTASPGSSKYPISSFFDYNKAHKTGYTLGIGREKTPHGGHIELEPLKVPGPGAYESLKTDRGQRYSLRDRTKVLDKKYTIDNQNDNPGPGRYEDPQALSPKGKYSVSKHVGTGATLFNPRRSTRFFEFSNTADNVENHNPGPGAYQPPSAIMATSHYVNSRHEGTGQRAFSTGRKISKFDECSKTFMAYPGPGSYRHPSDFGNYDGDVYDRTNMITRRSKIRL